MISEGIKKYVEQTYLKTRDLYPNYPLLIYLKELARTNDEERFLSLLKYASEQEIELIKQGAIPDEDGDGKGFFTEFYNSLLDEDENGNFDGLGRFSLKNAWKRAKDKLKKGFNKIANSKIGSKLIKYNPAAISLRTALRTLLSVNFRGYASRIKARPDVYQKVIDLYKNKLKGSEAKIKAAIERGSRKKPFFGGKTHGLEGLEGDIGVIEWAALISAAGSLFAMIEKWLGIKGKNNSKNKGKNSTSSHSQNNTPTSYPASYPTSYSVSTPSLPATHNTGLSVKPNIGGSSKAVKVGLSLLGGGLIGGAVYYFAFYKPKHKKNQLQGIKFN